MSEWKSAHFSPNQVITRIFTSFAIIYVSLQLSMQNAVSAQPCVGKLGISLSYLTFWVVILDYGLKLHKLSIHTLVMLQK